MTEVELLPETSAAIGETVMFVGGKPPRVVRPERGQPSFLPPHKCEALDPIWLG